jgi:hypothetical protein
MQFNNVQRADGLSTPLMVGRAGEHLACAELLLQGWTASLADPSLPYDILVDIGTRFYKIQVKSTCKPIERRKKYETSSTVLVYSFTLRRPAVVTRHTRKPERRRNLGLCDFVALVALDRRIVGFMPVEKLLFNGRYAAKIELKCKAFDYHRAGRAGKDPAKYGLFIDDYLLFEPEGHHDTSPVLEGIHHQG